MLDFADVRRANGDLQFLQIKSESLLGSTTVFTKLGQTLANGIGGSIGLS